MSQCLLLLALLLFSPQTFLKILKKQFCFLHKMKALPLSTNNVYQRTMCLFTNPKRTLNFSINCLLLNAFRNLISERRRLTRPRFNTSVAGVPPAHQPPPVRVSHTFCVMLFLSSTVYIIRSGDYWEDFDYCDSIAIVGRTIAILLR